MRITEKHVKHPPDHLRASGLGDRRKRSPKTRPREHLPEDKTQRKPVFDAGGRDWDRTSDPYDVNVVLSR